MRILTAFMLIATLVAASLASARGAERGGNNRRLRFAISFENALSYARANDQIIFIACLGPDDDASRKLDDLLHKNAFYLHPDEVILFRYRVSDDARLQSFRKRFRVTGEKLPIVVITSSDGTPIAQHSGPLSSGEYLDLVEDAAGSDVLDLPGEMALKRSIAGALDSDRKRKGDKYHTGFRTWTLATGERFNGAVTGSTSLQITFRTETGDVREVPAEHLSRADLDYLQDQLSGVGTGNSVP